MTEDQPVPSIPDHVTHYFRRGTTPFRNLSDVRESELASVLAGLATLEYRAGSARRFGPDYMRLRRSTEDRARELLMGRGGRPERTAPHYFVLGASDWFRGLYADADEVRLPLSSLPPHATSATWGDSISALGLGVAFGLPAPDPAHDRIYRLDELEPLVAAHGIPDPPAPFDVHAYQGHHRTNVDAYVEIQLWSDVPIRHLLAGESHSTAGR